MTNEEKVTMTKNLAGGNWSDEMVNAYLSLAAEKIIGILWPCEDGHDEVPEKYHMRQCDIAAYLMNKRGAEGEISHSENGVSRSYESASVPPSMLEGIIPYVKVLL